MFLDRFFKPRTVEEKKLSYSDLVVHSSPREISRVELATAVDRAVDRFAKQSSSGTFIQHYKSKLSIPCRECGSRAYLSFVEEKVLDGSLARGSRIVVECNECDYTIFIAETQQAARFLLSLFDELDPPFEEADGGFE